MINKPLTLLAVILTVTASSVIGVNASSLTVKTKQPHTVTVNKITKINRSEIKTKKLTKLKENNETLEEAAAKNSEAEPVSEKMPVKEKGQIKNGDGEQLPKIEPLKSSEPEINK